MSEWVYFLLVTIKKLYKATIAKAISPDAGMMSINAGMMQDNSVINRVFLGIVSRR